MAAVKANLWINPNLFLARNPVYPVYLEIQCVREGAPDLAAILAKVDQVVRGIAGITPWEFDDHIARYTEALAKSEELIAVAQEDLDAILSRGEDEPQAVEAMVGIGGALPLVLALLKIVNLYRNGASYGEIFEAAMALLALLGQSS
jgi:hypothetical protein